jgi:mRNA interferase RelE/StbE
MQKVIKDTFIKDIKNINDEKLKLKLSKIIKEIEDCEHIFLIENVKKINGHNDYYRIKVGSFRIGIHYDKKVLTLVRFLHRKEIYRYFPK